MNDSVRGDDFFDLVENSELSPRLINILLSNNIVRLSRLSKMDDSEVLLLRNVGHDYLHEIRSLLARYRKSKPR